MRPRGEVRQALGEAAQALAAECRAATWRDLAQRAAVGHHVGVAWDVAKQTVRDMARAGELRPVGTVQVPHSRRPMVLYEPGAGWATAGVCSLDSAVRAWVR